MSPRPSHPSAPSDDDPGAVPDDAELVARRVPNGDSVATVRLEAAYWSALDDIAAREGKPVNEICQAVAVNKGGRRLSEALRVYAVQYFRAAAKHAGTAEPSAPSQGETAAQSGPTQRPRRSTTVAKLRGAIPRV